jgi:hypothetical protein
MAAVDRDTGAAHLGKMRELLAQRGLAGRAADALGNLGAAAVPALNDLKKRAEQADVDTWQRSSIQRAIAAIERASANAGPGR